MALSRALPGRRRVAIIATPVSTEDVRSTFWRLIPVALPPGRLRLATRPNATGSPPVAKTIGMVAVAALAASCRQ
jgi:hypothetical protein